MLRLPPRIMMGAGLLMAIVGHAAGSPGSGVHSGYWPHAVPGRDRDARSGWAWSSCRSTTPPSPAWPPSDAGVASALINSTQQVGGSVGTALLNTIATTATPPTWPGMPRRRGSRWGQRGRRDAATVHGFSVAFAVAAAILGLALIVVPLLINAPVGVRGAPSRLPAWPRTALRPHAGRRSA